MEGKKRFGLILPKKAEKFNAKVRSVFESEDSEDEMTESTKQKNKPSGTTIKSEKGNKITDEDPNIYEYDSIYNEIKGNQLKKSAKPVNKEPRYIASLLKAAEKRKKESERRVERKIQSERNKEGDAFKDKEAFVTSAYRKKMIEMEEEEESEQREQQLEDIMDITKQKDLSGFYRHFLKQTVGEEQIPKFGEKHSLHEKDNSENREEKGKSFSSESLKNKDLSGAPTDKDRFSVVSDRNQQRNRILTKKDKYQMCDYEKSTVQKYDFNEIGKAHHSDNQNTVKYAERSSHNTLSCSKTKEKFYPCGLVEQYSATEMNAAKHSHNQDTPNYDERNLHHSLSPENKSRDKHKATCFSGTKGDSNSETENSNGKDTKRLHGINKRKQLDLNDEREHCTEEKAMIQDKNYDSNGSSHSDSSHSKVNKKKRIGDKIYHLEQKMPKNKSVKVEQINSKGSEKKHSKQDLLLKFAKRTVGTIFEEARARYLERQMLRKMTSRTAETA